MKIHSRWLPEEDARMIELLKCGCTQTATAEKLTDEFDTYITRGGVKNRLERIRKSEHIQSEGNMFPDYVYTAHQEFQHSNEKKEQMKDIYQKFVGKKCFIISFSDVHSPLIDFKMIESVLRGLERLIQEKRKQGFTVVIVLNGDIYDFSQMSKFSQGKNRVNLESEIKLANELINVCCKLADNVVALLGNHDARLFSYISRMAEKQPEVISYLENKLDPLRDIDHKNFNYINHIELQIGGMVFVHPFGFNKPALRTVTNVKNGVLANKKDFPNPDQIQGVAIGHTHQLGFYIENEVMIMEQGHSSHSPDYKMEKRTDRAWVKGYAIIELDEKGNVDFVNTRPIPYLEV